MWRYHSTMKIRSVLAAVLAASTIVVSAGVMADELPDLGDVSQAAITPVQERRLGKASCARSGPIRLIWTMPRSSDYLNVIGYRLVGSSPDPAGPFEFFASATIP